MKSYFLKFFYSSAITLLLVLPQISHAFRLSSELPGSYVDANGIKNVNHGFEFDALRDSPDALILDYRYSLQNRRYVANSTAHHRVGFISQRTAAAGYSPLGAELYVKWRIKSTGQVIEDTVDLIKILPANMERQTIYFIIEDAQLFVYLISFDTVKTTAIEETTRQRDELRTPRQQAFYSYLGNNVQMIYPAYQKLYPANLK